MSNEEGNPKSEFQMENSGARCHYSIIRASSFLRHSSFGFRHCPEPPYVGAYKLMPDLKFALRQLLKNPGFAAVAVLTLALGIGATASVFSLIHGVLLTPPPYRKPEQIVLLTPERIDVMPPGIRFLPSPSDAAEPNYDVNAL